MRFQGEVWRYIPEGELIRWAARKAARESPLLVR